MNEEYTVRTFQNRYSEECLRFNKVNQIFSFNNNDELFNADMLSVAMKYFFSFKKKVKQVFSFNKNDCSSTLFVAKLDEGKILL